MENIWKDTDYAICPACKQVVSRQELARGIHLCWEKPRPSLGIFEC